MRKTFKKIRRIRNYRSFKYFSHEIFRISLGSNLFNSFDTVGLNLGPTGPMT